jgi:hypothetical protein
MSFSFRGFAVFSAIICFTVGNLGIKVVHAADLLEIYQ